MVFIAVALGGCAHLGASDVPFSPPPDPPVPTTFRVPTAELPEPFVLIAYGDTRFTDASETSATNPDVRRALIAKIAAEQPAAIFINGDLPWHGLPGDYEVYREESRSWRDQHLRIYPALGNHEFSNCAESECLE